MIISNIQSQTRLLCSDLYLIFLWTDSFNCEFGQQNSKIQKKLKCVENSLVKN